MSEPLNNSANKDYSAGDIKILEGLEAVRKTPCYVYRLY